MKKNKNLPLFDKATMQIFEQVADIGINIIDASGRFVLFSNGSEIMDNMKREDVMGRHVLEVYEFYDGQVSPALRVLKNGVPMKNHSIDYKNNAGRRVEAISSIYPIFDQDHHEIIGSMCIYRDKSDFVMLSRRIKQLEKALNQCGKNPATRHQFADIIGTSEIIKNCIQQSRMISDIMVPVLIYGETGTGKEVFAQSIHNAGANWDKPFVALNCSAIPENLLESTLFGTVKGAFTGSANSQGLLEAAGQGTLFLDEINSMDMALQAKILRALETGLYRRVGAISEIKSEARIISAMNEDPQVAIDKGHLRSDLYYRLSAFSIQLPPLRVRREDILPLARTFLRSECANLGKKLYDFSEDACAILCAYDWPGNVRELKHVVLRAILTANSEDRTVTASMLPENIQKARAFSTAARNGSTLRTMTLDFERHVIMETLKAYEGNVTQSAKALGLKRQNLQYKMKALGISRV